MITVQLLGMAVLVAIVGMAIAHLISERSKRKLAEEDRWRAFAISDTAYGVECDFKSSSFPYRVDATPRDHRGALIVIHAEDEDVCPMRVRANAISLLIALGWQDSGFQGHWEIVCFGGLPIERPPAGNQWGGFAFTLKGAR